MKALAILQFTSAMRGVPVSVPNLLEGLPWTAGANTTLSIADGFARATRAGANPRIYKHVTGLTVGATYRLLGNGYLRTCTNIVLRAAQDATIAGGEDYSSALIPNDHLFDVNFVSSRTFQYIGFIGTSTVNGQFCECDEDFRMELVSLP